jgi:3-dehydroquinate dehydratase-2
MSSTILILNGPNLNLLGQREPHIYGRQTLRDIEARSREVAARLGLELDFRQSNHEGQLIDWIHEARGKAAGIIINPGAFTHTSIAIHDALKTFEGPIVELHLSNVHQREAFRHHSYVSLVAKAVLFGFGAHGYELAIEGISWLLEPKV